MSGGAGADRFLPQAIAIVKEAIALDEATKFEEAYGKYKAALERFLVVSRVELRSRHCVYCCVHPYAMLLIED